MPGGQATVARATAAVFVAGRQGGSAVLVTDRHLVTAAHVLTRTDPGTGARMPVPQVVLEFPGTGMRGDRLVALPLELGAAAAGLDVAVLDLGEDRPSWLPAPVQVWPARRPPEKVRVFGYPLREESLNGVWRLFDVAGPSAAGSMQLDWAGDAGTFPGHSGGPVIDADEGALAGILVEGAERGRFDRYIPVTLIAVAWPQLPRPWLVTGADGREARGHFTRRSRGQRSSARGGDLFRGRQAALDRITEWLADDKPPGLPLVLTGQPGAGKSAVLARAVLAIENGHDGPGLAFHARAAAIGDFLAALATLVGVDMPATADDLVADLAALPGDVPIKVAVDALDEAASDHDRRQIAAALAELAVLPGLRVAVATRPLAAGNPYAHGGLLHSLGVTARGCDNLIDLDDDAYFDLDGLRAFAAALLAQDGVDRPGPPEGAWTGYRAAPAVRDRLAEVIADRAGRNFLVAAMAAFPLSTAREMMHPGARGFDPVGIASGVGEALGKYLDHLPEERSERDRGLLTALAYARGAGLDDPVWLAFAAALGCGATVGDLDALRRSPAADYLLQITAADRDGQPLTRLFHQALADELLEARQQRASDESRLLGVLIGEAGQTGWQDRYARGHAAEHASAAGRLDELLEEGLYLISVDPARLIPYLGTARSAEARSTSAVYRQAAHHLTDLDRPMRASQLELTAHQLGCRGLATRIAATAPDRPWQTRWSHGRRIGHQVLSGHDDLVVGVAPAVLRDGTSVVVSGAYDGTVRVWRLADGTAVGEPLRGHDRAVTSVAVGALADGTPVVVSGSHDGTVRVRRLPDGTPVWEPRPDQFGGDVHAVAVGALADGTPVVVSGGNQTVRVWRLADGTPVGEPLLGHERAVTTVAVGALADGSAVVVSGGLDGTVRVWRLDDGTPVGEPLRGHDEWVRGVTVGALPDGTPVVVSGANDGTIRVWRLADGTPVGEPLRGHGYEVYAVAVGALADGVPVVVSGGYDGTVRVWRLADGTPVGEPLRGHDGHVYAVAVSALADGTPVIISGGADRTVRVWRLAGGTPAGEPLLGHDDTVWAVAVGALPDGTPVVVSVGDKAVRLWRLADGTPLGEPLRGHDGQVYAVAVGALPDGTPVAVTGGGDKTVRLWRLADGAPVGKPLRHPYVTFAVAVGALADGTPVVVSGDGAVTASRLADGEPVGKPWSTSSGGGLVMSIAVGALADGTPVVVGGSTDSTVQVWRLADGARVGGPFLGPHGSVYKIKNQRMQNSATVAVAALADGTQVVVSGRYDGTVLVNRLADGAPVRTPLRGHEGGVTALAVGAQGDGTPVVVTGGNDGLVRVQRLGDGIPLVPPLCISRRLNGVAVHGNVIVSAAGADIAIHEVAALTPVS